jgi:hypothetical protein
MFYLVVSRSKVDCDSQSLSAKCAGETSGWFMTPPTQSSELLAFAADDVATDISNSIGDRYANTTCTPIGE